VVVLLGVDTEGKAKGKGFLRPCQNSKMIVTDDECQKDPIFCILFPQNFKDRKG